MKIYIAKPASYAYQLGWNNILYSPNAACGTKSVNIRNNATRVLYIYTPYTPNAAALANLYGLGDSCSAYGNRNFWDYYSDWFGSPTGYEVLGDMGARWRAIGSGASRPHPVPDRERGLQLDRGELQLLPELRARRDQLDAVTGAWEDVRRHPCPVAKHWF